MAMSAEEKERMRKLFVRRMREAAEMQAQERIEAHLAFCETWYGGEWTLDLIQVSLIESYGSHGMAALQEAKPDLSSPPIPKEA